jgi:hypothetical protein
METDIAKLNAHIAGRFTTKESATNYLQLYKDFKRWQRVKENT